MLFFTYYLGVYFTDFRLNSNLRNKLALQDAFWNLLFFKSLFQYQQAVIKKNTFQTGTAF